MIRYLTFYVLCGFLLLQACGSSQKQLTTQTDTSSNGEIEVDGLSRTYIFDPSSGGKEKKPLLIALHGGFGSGAQVKESYGLDEDARKHGYAIVYPDGISKRERLKVRTWNAGGCCGYAAESEVDDVKFISVLIDTLVAKENVDPERIFVTGMSNGAMMAYRLACEIPEKIKAIAPVAGYVLPAESCGSAVPIIHFHSLQDKNVPFEGGPGDGVSDFAFPSFEEVTSLWAQINRCESGVRTIKNENSAASSLFIL